MRHGENWWTPEEAENGMVPHNAVYDPASGVYREIIENAEEDALPLAPPRSPLRSEHMVRALTVEQLELTDEEEIST